MKSFFLNSLETIGQILLNKEAIKNALKRNAPVDNEKQTKAKSNSVSKYYKKDNDFVDFSGGLLGI